MPALTTIHPTGVPEAPDRARRERSAVQINERPKLGKDLNGGTGSGSTPRAGRASLSHMLATVCHSADLTLNDDGAQLFAQALDEAACGCLETVLAALPRSRPGVRIWEGRQLRPFLYKAGPIGAIAASVLGEQARPVRAILFDKTAERNWSLGWHQDRTIVVKERMDTDGYGPWTVKSGLIQGGTTVRDSRAHGDAARAPRCG